MGLIGENGAGKSHADEDPGRRRRADAGTIVIDGVEHAGADRRRVDGGAGIAFVHQELNLFDNLDVAANVFIGREPRRGGPLRLIDRRPARAGRAAARSGSASTSRPTTPVAELSIAQRQMVEIAKALSLDARLMIMDEPTSSLTLTETDRLLQVVADLKAQGVSVIYISHRLGEVAALRRPRRRAARRPAWSASWPGTRSSHAAMIRLMIGRDLKSLYIPPKAAPVPSGCEIDDLRTTPFPTTR